MQNLQSMNFQNFITFMIHENIIIFAPIFHGNRDISTLRMI